MAMSVNMLSERWAMDCQARTKNGQPHQRTTGVLRMNCVQRETSPCIHAGAVGTRCDIASTNTGRLKAAPIQKRRAMSSSSVVSSGVLAEIVFGSKAMPQIGQEPGPICSTSGCMGQV